MSSGWARAVKSCKQRLLGTIKILLTWTNHKCQHWLKLVGLNSVFLSSTALHVFRRMRTWIKTQLIQSKIFVFSKQWTGKSYKISVCAYEGVTKKTETGILSSQLLLNNSREIPKAKPENTLRKSNCDAFLQGVLEFQPEFCKCIDGSGKKIPLKIPVKLQFSLNICNSEHLKILNLNIWSAQAARTL